MNNIRIYWKKLGGKGDTLTLYEATIIIPNRGKNYKLGDKFNVKEYTINTRYSLFPSNETTAYKYLEVIEVDDKYFYILKYSNLFLNKEDPEVQEIIDYITTNLL